MNKPMHRIIVGAAAALLSVGAAAAPVSWKDSGGSGEAPATASFVAASSGQLVAYFTTGSLAGYANLVGVRINDGADNPAGLSNHTSVYGDTFVLGNVTTGDKLVFFIDANAGAARYYTDPGLNHDGAGGTSVNHAWATAYAGDSVVPAGTHIAFEDLLGGGDFNYQDHGFVFKITAVPEPASWALLLGGVAGLAALRRRR